MFRHGISTQKVLLGTQKVLPLVVLGTTTVVVVLNVLVVGCEPTKKNAQQTRLARKLDILNCADSQGRHANKQAVR